MRRRSWRIVKQRMCTTIPLTVQTFHCGENARSLNRLQEEVFAVDLGVLS